MGEGSLIGAWAPYQWLYHQTIKRITGYKSSERCGDPWVLPASLKGCWRSLSCVDFKDSSRVQQQCHVQKSVLHSTAILSSFRNIIFALSVIFPEYWREWRSGAIYTWAFNTHLFSALWSIISFTVTANHCGKKTYYCVDLISDFERQFDKEIMVIHQNNNSSPTTSYDFSNLGFLIYSTIHEFLLVKSVSNLMKSDWLSLCKLVTITLKNTSCRLVCSVVPCMIVE